MSNLTEFLLARIAEDEDEARRLADRYPSSSEDGGWFGNSDDVDIRLGVGRGMSECASKRAAVKEALKWERMHIEARGYMKSDDVNLLIYKAKRSLSGDFLRYLGLPYADHPDYRDEWRPTT